MANFAPPPESAHASGPHWVDPMTDLCNPRQLVWVMGWFDLTQNYAASRCIIVLNDVRMWVNSLAGL
jgi:hypothetical protein